MLWFSARLDSPTTEHCEANGMEVAPRGSRMTRHTDWSLLGLLLLPVVVVVGGVCFYQTQRHSLRRDAERMLLSVSQLKSSQIGQWRRQQLATSDSLKDSPFIQAAIQQRFSGDAHGEDDRLRQRLAALCRNHRYDNVLLVDAKGSIAYQVRPGPSTVHARTLDAMLKAFAQDASTFSSLHRDPGEIHLGVVTPFFAADGGHTPLAAIVAVCRAGTFLYPLIQKWPVPSATAEVLVVRREDDHILFLNELRWQSNTALGLRRPLSEASLPAVRAAMGEQAIVEGRDYRGVKVLAALRRIPNSNWFMVAKVDAAEILSVWRRETALIVALLVAIVSACTAGAVAVWHRRSVRYHQSMAQARLALDETQKQLRAHFDASIVGMAIGTDDGKWTRVNGALAEMLGYTIEELCEKTWQDVTHPDDRELSAAEFARVLAGETDRYRIEKRFLHRDGHPVHTILSVRAVRTKDGTIEYMLSQFQDITERKRQEEILRESEERFRGYFEASPIGMAIVGPDKSWQRVNPALSDMLGYQPEELQNRPWTDMTHPKDMLHDQEEFGRLVAGAQREYHLEKRFLRKDGAAVDALLSVRGVYNRDGKFVYAVKQVRDITLRKRAEGELRRMNGELQRSNEELQQFAYVASHDLQEPLRMVSSYTQLLEEMYGEELGEEARKWIHYAVDGANRMQALIEDLLSYSRVTTRGRQFESIDSHAALGQALANLRALIQETEAIITNDDLPEVAADAGQLVQLFQNLLGNAIKYRKPDTPPPCPCVRTPERGGLGVRRRGQRHWHRDQVSGPRVRYLPASAYKTRVPRHRNRPGHLPTHRREARRQNLVRLRDRQRHHLPIHTRSRQRQRGNDMTAQQMLRPVEILLVEDNPGDAELGARRPRQEQDPQSAQRGRGRRSRHGLPAPERRIHRRDSSGPDSPRSQPPPQGRARGVGGNQGGSRPETYSGGDPDDIEGRGGCAEVLRPARQLLHHQAHRPLAVHEGGEDNPGFLALDRRPPATW